MFVTFNYTFCPKPNVLNYNRVTDGMTLPASQRRPAAAVAAASGGRTERSVGRRRSASASRAVDDSWAGRRWTALLDNLRGLVDQMYSACETHSSVLQCKEAIMLLDASARDFHSLIKWLKIQWEYENTPLPQRPSSVSWEIRKTLPNSHSRVSQLNTRSCSALVDASTCTHDNIEPATAANTHGDGVCVSYDADGKRSSNASTATFVSKSSSDNEIATSALCNFSKNHRCSLAIAEGDTAVPLWGVCTSSTNTRPSSITITRSVATAAISTHSSFVSKSIPVSATGIRSLPATITHSVCSTNSDTTSITSTQSVSATSIHAESLPNTAYPSITNNLPHCTLPTSTTSTHTASTTSTHTAPITSTHNVPITSTYTAPNTSTHCVSITSTHTAPNVVFSRARSFSSALSDNVGPNVQRTCVARGLESSASVRVPRGADTCCTTRAPSLGRGRGWRRNTAPATASRPGGGHALKTPTQRNTCHLSAVRTRSATASTSSVVPSHSAGHFAGRCVDCVDVSAVTAHSDVAQDGSAESGWCTVKGRSRHRQSSQRSALALSLSCGEVAIDNNPRDRSLSSSWAHCKAITHSVGGLTPGGNDSTTSEQDQKDAPTVLATHSNDEDDIDEDDDEDMMSAERALQSAIDTEHSLELQLREAQDSRLDDLDTDDAASLVCAVETEHAAATVHHSGDARQDSPVGKMPRVSATAVVTRRFAAELAQMSWADQVEFIEQRLNDNHEDQVAFSSADSPSAGTAVDADAAAAAETAESPDGHTPPHLETIRRLEERQARAERRRRAFIEQKTRRLSELSGKIAEVRRQKQVLLARRRAVLERKMARADEQRRRHLLDIVRRAHDEEAKAREIAFINEIEAQNRRLDRYELEESQRARLAGLCEERQRRADEKAALAAAVGQKRRHIQQQRLAQLELIRQRRRQRLERIDLQLRQREEQRQEMARVKQRDRDERISALQAAHQATAQHLQQRIKLKQQQSAKRHEENMELIRQRALELGARGAAAAGAAATSTAGEQIQTSTSLAVRQSPDVDVRRLDERRDKLAAQLTTHACTCALGQHRSCRTAQLTASAGAAACGDRVRTRLMRSLGDIGRLLDDGTRPACQLQRALGVCCGLLQQHKNNAVQLLFASAGGCSVLFSLLTIAGRQTTGAFSPQAAAASDAASDKTIGLAATLVTAACDSQSTVSALMVDVGAFAACVQVFTKMLWRLRARMQAQHNAASEADSKTDAGESLETSIDTTTALAHAVAAVLASCDASVGPTSVISPHLCDYLAGGGFVHVLTLLFRRCGGGGGEQWRVRLAPLLTYGVSVLRHIITAVLSCVNGNDVDSTAGNVGRRARRRRRAARGGGGEARQCAGDDNSRGRTELMSSLCETRAVSALLTLLHGQLPALQSLNSQHVSQQQALQQEVVLQACRVVEQVLLALQQVAMFDLTMFQNQSCPHPASANTVAIIEDVTATSFVRVAASLTGLCSQLLSPTTLAAVLSDVQQLQLCRLLTLLLPLIGCYCVASDVRQQQLSESAASSLAAPSPAGRASLLQQLLRLPVQFFSEPRLRQLLYPTLLVCCRDNQPVVRQLAQEFSYQELDEFIVSGECDWTDPLTSLMLAKAGFQKPTHTRK